MNPMQSPNVGVGGKTFRNKVKKSLLLKAIDNLKEICTDIGCSGMEPDMCKNNPHKCDIIKKVIKGVDEVKERLSNAGAQHFCPFCGSTELKEGTKTLEGRYFYLIQCKDCLGMMLTDYDVYSVENNGELLDKNEISVNIERAKKDCHKKWSRRVSNKIK